MNMWRVGEDRGSKEMDRMSPYTQHFTPMKMFLVKQPSTLSQNIKNGTTPLN
jgi:hypothetical protein